MFATGMISIFNVTMRM